MPNVVILFVEGSVSYRHFRNFPRHDVLIATNRSFSADHDFSAKSPSASPNAGPILQKKNVI
jgi:hypothetical protein